MQRIAAILHLFLAFLLLSSSSGLVIGEHYCQGQRVQTALFRQADGCGMEKKGKISSCKLRAKTKSGQTQISQSDCCQDRVQLLKTENQQDKTPQQELLQKPVLTSPIFSENDCLPANSYSQKAKNHLPKDPPPPKPGRQHLAAFTQSFLF